MQQSRLFLQALTFFVTLIMSVGNSSAAQSSDQIAAPKPIDQRLPDIPKPWYEQTEKDRRYSGYELWLTAFDGAARAANSHFFCKQPSQRPIPGELIGHEKVIVAERTVSKRPYRELVDRPYHASDVIWVDPSYQGQLFLGDIIIHYKTYDNKAKPTGYNDYNGYRSPIYPRATIITSDTEFDKIALSDENKYGSLILYRNGKFSLISTPERYSSDRRSFSCGGQATLSFGGIAVSASAMFKGAIGVNKELFDNDSNRYYRGLGRPQFRRFTADEFSIDQLKWMLVDQMSVEYAEGVFSAEQKQQFKVALSAKTVSIANKLQLSKSTIDDVFRTDWRGRGAYLAIYAGHNMNLPIDSYISFLDQRERVIHGAVDPEYSKIRAELLRYWFAEMSGLRKDNAAVAPDLENSIAAMSISN